MSVVNIKGKDLVVEHIVAVSEAKKIKTGSMNCDWDYGFTVTMTGGAEVDILVPTKTDSCGNNLLSRNERDEEVKKVRKELLDQM